MLGNGTGFIQFLDLNFVFEHLAPLTHGSMPSLSVDFAENYLGSGFALDLIKNFESVLSKPTSHDLEMSLTQKWVDVKSGSPLEITCGQLFAQGKWFDILECIIHHFCSHESFKIWKSCCYDIIYRLFELKYWKYCLLHSEYMPLLKLSPLDPESLCLLCPMVPLLKTPLLFSGSQNLMNFIC